jgi:PhnB protein
MHASLKIGDAQVFLCDDFPEYCGGKARSPKALGGISLTLHRDVEDCDAAIAKAVANGATVSMPAMDAFWGDRYGKILDPFGYEWSFAHRLPADRAQAAAAEWEKECAGATATAAV